VAALAAVPLERLCPVGFVFVWADKAHLHAVVKLLYARKFVYVENLTWVHMGPDNRALALDAPHSRASHTTLLMFRKDGAIQTFMHESSACCSHSALLMFRKDGAMFSASSECAGRACHTLLMFRKDGAEPFSPMLYAKQMLHDAARIGNAA